MFSRHSFWKTNYGPILHNLSPSIWNAFGVSKQCLIYCLLVDNSEQDNSEEDGLLLLQFQTIVSTPVCFLFSFLLWSVCSLEGILVPLVRQKCRVEQNLHSTFMVCVGRPICTCLEQIRPAAAHGRPIPCWLFMIKICFGKPRSLDSEIRGSFLLALTPLHIYNQRFHFPAWKEKDIDTEKE